MPDAPATLTKDVVVGIKAHTTDEQTSEVIAAADCVRSLVGDVSLPNPEADRFDRANVGKDLEREPGRPTRKKMTLGHTEEILLNQTDPANVPYFDAPLRACGFQRSTVRRIEVDSDPGYRAGERIGDNADMDLATKTAVLISVETDTGGGGEIYVCYVLLTGVDFADGDTIHGEDTVVNEAVAAGAAAADTGHLYRPLSESTGVVPPAATVVHYRGGKRFEAICRGNATFRFSEANPGVIEFELMGPPILTAQLGLVQGDPPADIPVVPAVAELATGAQFIIDPGGDDFAPPILATFELRTGNQVSDRPTITATSIGTSGYAPPRVRAREAALSFDPEDVADATHDIVRRAMAGDTLRFDCRYGDWSKPGGRVAAHVYACQYNAPSYQDRDNVLVSSIEAPIRRGPRIDWPFYVALLYSP